MNEQAIAKLRALKAEPGILMHWQDRIDEVIADLSAPPVVVSPPLPPPVPLPMEEVEEVEEDSHPAAKSKVTTAAHVSHSTHKGK